MAMFCVFDGHAGKDCSNKLTRLFPKIFIAKWKTLAPTNPTDLTDLWNDVYKTVDDGLREFEYQGYVTFFRRKTWLIFSWRSTSTTAFIWKSNGRRYLQCANLGDSLGFLCRAGQALELTQEHKVHGKWNDRLTEFYSHQHPRKKNA